MTNIAIVHYNGLLKNLIKTMLEKPDLASLKGIDSKAKRYLLEGGSKAGAFHYLQELGGFEKRLPTGTKYLEPGGDIAAFLKDLGFDKDKIIRLCTPEDFLRIVDVLKTTRFDMAPHQGLLSSNKNFAQSLIPELVQQEIEQQLEDADSEDVRSFAEYDLGRPFKGAQEVGVLMQDYCDGFKGSIMEHPHQRGMYQLEYSFPNGVLQTMLIDPLTVSKETWRFYHIRMEDFKKVIRLYQDVQGSGLIPPSSSWQMEFGKDNERDEILFLQGRLSRPYQERGDFEIPFDMDEIFTSKVYGVTPKEGIDIQIAQVIPECVSRYAEQTKMGYYNLVERGVTENLPRNLKAKPRNITAYFPISTNGSLLEHGHYRWLQKAEVTFVIEDFSEFFCRLFRGILPEDIIRPYGVGNLFRENEKTPGENFIEEFGDIIAGKMVRICSNGIAGSLKVLA